ncbi:hypothetical protein EJ110_NYTH26656 [Nymphaea thermarum]|nr:hypothetical protein EJ110_NYTH26656 [Nymphaea thermarum]
MRIRRRHRGSGDCPSPGEWSVVADVVAYSNGTQDGSDAVQRESTTRVCRGEGVRSSTHRGRGRQQGVKGFREEEAVGCAASTATVRAATVTAATAAAARGETPPRCRATGLACRRAGGARPQGTVVCRAWSVGSRLPNLGVLGKAEYLTSDFTQPRMSALPLQRMKWIHTVMGHHGECLSAMEYHRKGKKRAGPSTEAQREPSPAHSDAHTPLDDSSSGHQYAQLGGGAQTPLRQTPPVDQQTILLTTLQTLTSLVQTMVSNQRSNASPSGDTNIPVREKATAVSYQQFMAMQPPIFSGRCSYDKAKHWIEEIERIFVLLRMPEEDKVNYGTYLLKDDALDWWKSTLEIRFAGQPSLSWMQFRDSFLDTYYPVHARDQKMQEFLELQQNQLNLEDYITRYRHLEACCPHFYTTDGARAGKFVCGLLEGLRSKVLSSRPRDLDEGVTMARCIEEDWVRTQKDHQKRAGQHSQGGRTPVKLQHFAGRTRPYERRDDRTFRRKQPTRSEASQGSVATPTSQKCPTCSRVHPGKPCYRRRRGGGVCSVDSDGGSGDGDGGDSGSSSRSMSPKCGVRVPVRVLVPVPVWHISKNLGAAVREKKGRRRNAGSTQCDEEEDGGTRKRTAASASSPPPIRRRRRSQGTKKKKGVAESGRRAEARRSKKGMKIEALRP